MADRVCEVIVTAAEETWLADFARRLVADRLAACGQIVPAIRSIYRWNGEQHDEREARLALHTRLDLVPSIVAQARAEHPYEVPCVIALPVADGNPAYLEWVERETSTGEVTRP